MQFLYEGLNLTTQCEAGYRASVNPRLHIEFTLMRLSFLLARPADSPAPVAAPVQPSQTAQPTAVATPVAPVAPAPVPPAPVAATPAPVAATPAEPVQAPAPSVQAPAPAAEPESQPRERRRATRTSSLSLKSQRDDAPATESLASKSAEAPAPEDAAIREKWPLLAEKYSDKPRLSSMLMSSSLTIEAVGELKTVIFRVVNQSQKEWVESKLLHELESNFRVLLGSTKLNLRVAVVPDDPSTPREAYMPSERAKELMETNTEVKNLVQDFGLDIK